MKSTPKKTIPLPRTPQVHHLRQEIPLPVHDDSVVDSDSLFLRLMAEAGKVTVKDIQYSMDVNKTTAYAWWNGDKPHPFNRARKLLAQFPLHLYPTILEYIAGSNFDGDILTGEQHAALMVLAKRGSAT